MPRKIPRDPVREISLALQYLGVNPNQAIISAQTICAEALEPPEPAVKKKTTKKKTKK
jgi:hypothetical protein